MTAATRQRANPQRTKMMHPNSAGISDEFLAQLKQDLACRRVGHGMALLEDHRHLLTSFDPEENNAGLFAGYLAQWVDLGFERMGLVKDIVARFSKASRARLPFEDYLYLRMSEGMVAMSGENTDDAIRHFDFVLSLDQEIADEELVAIANFWKGRCLRMKGEYDQARASAIKGRDLALQLGHQPMAAVIQVLESWLLFQKGDAKLAIDTLREAETVLSKTDDYLTLGNIQSSYGRIARRQGRYQHAIDSFSTAIALYKKRDPRHRNVARTLTNMAYVPKLPDAAKRPRAAAPAMDKASFSIAIALSNSARRRWPNLPKRQPFTSSTNIITVWAV